MDASIKIPENDLILINDLKNELKKSNIKATQKELIDKSIQFSLKRKREFLAEMLEQSKKEDNTKELTNNFLNGKRFDLGKNWQEETDTTL